MIQDQGRDASPNPMVTPVSLPPGSREDTSAVEGVTPIGGEGSCDEENTNMSGSLSPLSGLRALIQAPLLAESSPGSIPLVDNSIYYRHVAMRKEPGAFTIARRAKWEVLETSLPSVCQPLEKDIPEPELERIARALSRIPSPTRSPTLSPSNRRHCYPCGRDGVVVRKVFIASTYSDMHAERELLQNRVIPAVNRLARPLGVSLEAAPFQHGIHYLTLTRTLTL